MNTTTLGTAAGSGGAAYAAVTIITWLASLGHVLVPDNVSNALIVLITIGVHYVVTNKKATAVMGITAPDPVVVPIKPPVVAPTPPPSQPAQIG